MAHVQCTLVLTSAQLWSIVTFLPLPRGEDSGIPHSRALSQNCLSRLVPQTHLPETQRRQQAANVTLRETGLFYPVQAPGPTSVQQFPCWTAPTPFWFCLPPSSLLTLSRCSALLYKIGWGKGRGGEGSYPSYRPSLCLPVRGSAFDICSGDNAYLPICFSPLPSPLEPGNLVGQLHALRIVGL